MARRRRPLPPSIRLPRRWGRHSGLTLVVLLVALAVLGRRSGPIAPSGDDWVRYHDQTFAVSRVVDGDTLHIAAPDADKSTTPIRLWGVDCPEVARGGQSAMHFGPEATAFAKETLEGRSVHVVLSPRQSRDRYQRLLAYVYLDRDGPMFNEMLLYEGLAYADRRFDHHYKRRFESLESDARRQGRGLWAEITPERMPEWRRRFE